MRAARDNTHGKSLPIGAAYGLASTTFDSIRQSCLCLCLQLQSVVSTFISSTVSVFMFAATKCGSDTSFVKGLCVCVCSYQVWFRHSFRQRFLCLCLQLPNLVPTLISVNNFCVYVCSYQSWFRHVLFSKVSVFIFAATRFGSDNNFVKGFCVYVFSYLPLIRQMSSTRYMMFTLIPISQELFFTGFASAADPFFIELYRLMDFIDYHRFS